MLVGPDRRDPTSSTRSGEGKAPGGHWAPTCDALAELDPDYLVPTHCTGRRAIHALAGRFPNAYLQTSVGTRFEFHSD